MFIILCSLILFVDCPDFNRHLLCLLVPRVGLEPTRPHRAIDFESIVSTNSTTWAYRGVSEIELISSHLQTLDKIAGFRFHSLTTILSPLGDLSSIYPYSPICQRTY